MTTETDIGEPLAGLLLALQRASAIYNSGVPGKDRGGSFEALIAVTEFFKRIGVEASLLRPLKAVILAFGDAERGQTNRLFEVLKLPHRPPLQIEDQMSKAVAAVAMELLMEGGKRQKTAAEEVAAAVRKWNLPALDSANVTWKVVKNWRDRLNAGSAEDPDVNSYRALKARSLRSEVDIVATARALLENPYRLHPQVEST